MLDESPTNSRDEGTPLMEPAKPGQFFRAFRLLFILWGLLLLLVAIVVTLGNPPAPEAAVIRLATGMWWLCALLLLWRRRLGFWIAMAVAFVIWVWALGLALHQARHLILKVGWSGFLLEQVPILLPMTMLLTLGIGAVIQDDQKL